MDMYSDDPCIVELLLKHGADVNVKDNYGRTALIQAAVYGYTKIAEFLIKHGVNVNVKDNNGDTALIYAIRRGHTETANLLRRYGAK